MKNRDFITIYKLDTNHPTSNVLNSGKWVDGLIMKELEEKLKAYLGVSYVVLTNSGTSALLSAYWALRKSFKSITVDPYTFPATYQPAKLLGYKVNFVRTVIKQKSLKMHNDDLFVATHLFGQPNRIISKLNNVSFIEDACQAFGTKFRGKNVGTFGEMGCFSFYPTKSLHTCGHGGAVVSNNKEYYEAVKIFVECGRKDGVMTENTALNLRMDEIKAEFLIHELKNFDKNIEIQRGIAKEFLQLIPPPQPFLEERDEDFHTYATFNILVRKRDVFRKYMDDLGIQTLVYYGDEILPNDERKNYQDLTSVIVAIPCRWNLTADEVRRIKRALKEWFK